MLPLMGALLALALMANLSIRGMPSSLSDIPALRILFILILIFFGMGIVAVGVMALVVMVSRFYRNLLKSEGYLMFTLPVSVHELIWSKLIVSLVWFFATALFIFLILAGCAAAGGQLSVTAAYQHAPARDISVFDYSQIIYAAFFGFLLFGEIPDVWSVIGYVIIIGTAFFKWYLVTRRG